MSDLSGTSKLESDTIDGISVFPVLSEALQCSPQGALLNNISPTLNLKPLPPGVT